MSKQCSNTVSNEVRVSASGQTTAGPEQQFKHSRPVRTTIQVHVYILKYVSLDHASTVINKR